MKKKSIFSLTTLLLSSAVIFSSCSGTGDTTEPESNMDKIREAYVYTLPMMLMDATMTNFINTEEAGKGRAPANQLLHNSALLDASFTDVVSPNRDTVYSLAYLDLDREPMVLIRPETDRFCSVEIMDFHTNAIAILGSGGDKQDAEVCVIARKGYDGKLPEGATLVESPTENASLIVRTMVYDDADLKNVKSIQSKIKLLPLSNYSSGEEYVPAKGTYKKENEFIPVKHVLSQGPKEYFSRANALMKTNPPTDADKDIVEKMKTVGVGPGEAFDESVLGENGDEAWKKMIADLEGYLYKQTAKFTRDIGGWDFSGEPIAEFGTEYEYRAIVALVGLGANPVFVAIYPSAETDSDGNKLNGKNNYVMHFEKDALPPVEEQGFWSITAYNEDHLFIDNEIDRYLINDRSKYVLNDDGSLDLYLQNEKPENKALINNWLPTGDGVYSLMMRIYLPEKEAADGKWKGPKIIKQ